MACASLSGPPAPCATEGGRSHQREERLATHRGLEAPALGRSPVLLTELRDPSVAELGGKAASLVRLAAAGFRVPQAAVLPASWFSSWWSELERSDAWSRFEATRAPPFAAACAALKVAADRLAFGEEMRGGLADLRELVDSWGPGASCAVRSSSPDEDLANASFAGGYTTRLGVAPEGIEDAIRACFVSCLDERVVLYKAQLGFDVHRPRIAVVVQRQLESEVSGVGFSIDPISNDYDTAVIDASFGLGETLVSGEVSPDHFVVDKPSHEILERRLGSKRVSRWVRPEGGVELRDETRGEQASLGDAQVLEIADALDRLERLYGQPLDVEWAYAGGELQLLQARPITTGFPLPEEMQTRPGAPRRLYMDGSLSDAITSNEPISTLTLDAYRTVMERLFASYGISLAAEQDPLEDFLVYRGSRVYIAFSDLLWFASPQKIATGSQNMDVRLVRTLESLDRSRYRPKRKPAWFTWGGLAGAIFGVLRGTRRMWWNSAVAFCAPARYLERYRPAILRFESEVRSVAPDVPVAALHDLHQHAFEVIMDVDLPTIYAWVAALGIFGALAKRADPRTRALLDRMARGIEGELVIEMGIEMFATARLLEPREFDDLARLAKRVESRELPAAFLEAWDALVRRFGARGPNEVELASPRYGEDPFLMLRQLSFMARAGPGHDPKEAHERHVRERREAFVELSARFGWLRRALLRLAQRWTEAFAGERDTAKYHWVLTTYAMRRAVLARGDRLVAERRLDSRGDVFHLTFDELEAAERDAGFDVRGPADERRRQFEELRRRVKEFPHLIDSRGRILRPPAATDEEGTLAGLGISPGLARGPIKVLENPHDKDIEPGDVLVAYTTDPGWTPLFINASAIILQIGGMMQHGGVVAREYGKPCVAGIEHVLTRFEDGQLVEVDGSAGVVRLIES